LLALTIAALAVVGGIAGLAFRSGDTDNDVTPTSSPGTQQQPIRQPTQAPTRQPAAVAAGTPEDALRESINTAALKDCRTKNPTDSQWVDAELNCTGTDGIPVAAYHFASRSEADRQIGALATLFTDSGNCDDGQQSIETWSTAQVPSGGTKLCYYYAEKYVIYWYYSEDGVAFAAQDQSPARLTAWWRSFDPVNH
jgi:hypothetical protein